MKAVAVLVGICGLVSLVLGGIIIVGYLDLREQANAVENARGLASVGAAFQLLGQFLKWAKDAFVLLIINLLVTGVALVLTAVALVKATSPR